MYGSVLSAAIKMTVEHCLRHLERIVQSNAKFLLEGEVTIAVLVCEMPHRERGGKNRLSLSNWKQFDYDSASTKKKSIVQIVNDDKLFLARAIVVGKAYIDKETDPSINWDQPSALAARPINAADAFYLLASTLLVAFPSQRSAVVSAVNEATRSLVAPGPIHSQTSYWRIRFS